LIIILEILSNILSQIPALALGNLASGCLFDGFDDIIIGAPKRFPSDPMSDAVRVLVIGKI
jgi:hypothetical protein